VSSLGFAGTAGASYTCSSYVTVQWGDTLSGIAALCGTTADAIRAANPGLGWWLYAGQTLYIPTGYSAPAYYPTYGGNYVVQWGDTAYSIATRSGITVNDLLAANPGIYDARYIYAGQTLNVPSAPSYYTVQSGDTLRIIAARYGTSVYSLQLLNPQIYNANWIYAGQVIRVR
jgi:LysM repeat protein